MNAQTALLIAKLEALPPERRAEVENFVDFLRTCDERERSAAAQRLGEAFAQTDALNLPTMTVDEIQAEIKAARAERRQRADRL